MSYDFEDLTRNDGKNDRGNAILWGIQNYVAAEVILLCAIDQFRSSPSKRKLQVIWDWICDQETKKAETMNWASANFQADGGANFIDKKRTAQAQYFKNRKTIFGKIKFKKDKSLGNIPAHDFFDGHVDAAIISLTTLDNEPSCRFSRFNRKNFKWGDAGQVKMLKAVEMLEREFATAGFNTAEIGISLPYQQ